MIFPINNKCSGLIHKANEKKNEINSLKTIEIKDPNIAFATVAKVKYHAINKIR